MSSDIATLKQPVQTRQPCVPAGSYAGVDNVPSISMGSNVALRRHAEGNARTTQTIHHHTGY